MSALDYLNISGAIEQIYAAAAEPDRWPAALQAIATCFGDIGAILIYTREDGSAATIVSPSLEAAQRDYANGWWEQDFRLTRALEHFYRAEHGPVTDAHFTTPEEMRTHAFYTDFQRRHGLFWIASMEISPGPNVRVALSIHRGPDRPAYDDDELKLFSQIGRHAEQSLRLAVRLLRAEITSIGLGETLSRLESAVFVVDENARIIFQNRAADGVLGDGLQEQNGRLIARGAVGDQFQRVLTKAADGALSDLHPEFLQPVVIARSRDRFPLVAHLIPLRVPQQSTLAQFLAAGRVAVLVQSMESERTAEPTLVRDILGLTLAEARLAVLVGTGLAPRDVAQQLGVKEETARTVLKRVFAKTGLSRQSELAALMTRLTLQTPT